MEQEDARLIEQSLAGQTDAFGQLVLKYQDRLYNSLVYVSGNMEDARDNVQDAFVQAFLKLDSFRGDSAFYTWLYRIARNVAATRRRRHRPTLPLDKLQDSGHADPADSGDGPLERVQRAEKQRQVHRAIRRLSDEYRPVIVLREIDGMDYDAIGTALDLPIGTVRSRLHRGRMQLKKELSDILKSEQ